MRRVFAVVMSVVVMSAVVVSAVVVSTAFASLALSSSPAVAQTQLQEPPAKPRHVKRPDPENATMPEKKDWVSQTIGDVLDGLDDLGRPLRDPQH